MTTAISLTTGQECKDEFVNTAMTFFRGQSSNILSDLWDICVLVAENVSKVDLNNDGIVKHSKEEIIAVIKDKGVEFGHGITEALVNLASGGFLKKLLAAANVAVILAKVGISSQIPYASIIIDLCIEWVVAGMKKGLIKLKEWFNQKIVKYKNEARSALGKLLKSLNALYKDEDIVFNTEHEFGVNMFTLIIARGEDSIKLYGSIRYLTSVMDDKDEWGDAVGVFEDKIEEIFFGREDE